MSYINNTNTAGEEIVSKFKFTKLEYVNPIKALMFPLTWFRRWKFEMGVTNKRVVISHGFIARKTAEIRLEAIESVGIKNTFFGRIFGYGDLTVAGRGNAIVTVPGLAGVAKIKRSIEAAKNELAVR